MTWPRFWSTCPGYTDFPASETVRTPQRRNGLAQTTCALEFIKEEEENPRVSALQTSSSSPTSIRGGSTESTRDELTRKKFHSLPRSIPRQARKCSLSQRAQQGEVQQIVLASSNARQTVPPIHPRLRAERRAFDKTLHTCALATVPKKQNITEKKPPL